MPTGFKGSNIALNNIRISGAFPDPTIAFDVLFTTEEGVVHATMAHSIPAQTSRELYDALAALSNVLIAWAEQTHFDHATRSPITKDDDDGIAETLRGSQLEDAPLFDQGSQ